MDEHDIKVKVITIAVGYVQMPKFYHFLNGWSIIFPISDKRGDVLRKDDPSKILEGMST